MSLKIFPQARKSLCVHTLVIILFGLSTFWFKRIDNCQYNGIKKSTKCRLRYFCGKCSFGFPMTFLPKKFFHLDFTNIQFNDMLSSSLPQFHPIPRFCVDLYRLYSALGLIRSLQYELATHF